MAVLATYSMMPRPYANSSADSESLAHQVGTGLGSGKVKTEGDYDFLAVRIPNHEAWSLVQHKELLGMDSAKFYPHDSKSKGQFEKYRDAFALLGDLTRYSLAEFATGFFFFDANS